MMLGKVPWDPYAEEEDTRLAWKGLRKTLAGHGLSLSVEERGRGKSRKPYVVGVRFLEEDELDV